jgi:hypothetical protein
MNDQLPLEERAIPEETAGPLPRLSAQESLEMVERLLVGLSSLGVEELLERIHYLQQRAEKDGLWQPDQRTQSNGLDTMRHIALGLLLRGQKRAFKSVNSGADLSLRVANSVLGTFYTLTDGPYTRQLRRPVNALLRNIQQKGQQLAREGRLEEQRGRWIAQKTVSDISEDLIGYISHSPELAELVSDQVSKQSTGLVEVVVDNSRQLSVGADNVLESMVRRLFRMTARDELPRSPLAGKLQTMYTPDTIVSAKDKPDG